MAGVYAPPSSHSARGGTKNSTEYEPKKHAKSKIQEDGKSSKFTETVRGRTDRLMDRLVGKTARRKPQLVGWNYQELRQQHWAVTSFWMGWLSACKLYI